MQILKKEINIFLDFKKKTAKIYFYYKLFFKIISNTLYTNQ